MTGIGKEERLARSELLDTLRQRLDDVQLRDRPRLAQRLERLADRRVSARSLEDLARVERDIDRSCELVAARRDTPLTLNFDPGLPISGHVGEIRDALEGHPVIVVCGETGSGKSTQLPKICLAAGRGIHGLIGHTQPRRIAARSLAERIATELEVGLGAAVGYQVRFTDRTGPRARVKLMTDGILLRELEHDRELRRYDTLIIDEAHERSLSIDFLLGVLKGLLPSRPELRVIITSATIEPDRFARFFGGVPVINVSGRGYPVEVRYRPVATDDDDDGITLAAAVVGGVAELLDRDVERSGDVLVFLPGEKEIREAAAALKARGPGRIEVLPLFARLSAAEQARIFEPHARPRVILATNIAETSITVPGVRSVVDSGLARISRYSTRLRVQRLPIEPISKASAEQRKGRCGRVAPGICIRLYSEEDFALREDETPPEVLRTNLASVILRMATLGLGAPEAFPFLDAPDTRLIGDGYRLLEELGAVDGERRVTRLGRDMAALPVDPRLARMLLAATHEGCLGEMLVIAAFLAIQDPRERAPAGGADGESVEAAWTLDARSDFVTVLNLYAAFTAVAASATGSAIRRWCKEHALAFLRMREWQDLVAQLEAAVAELGHAPSGKPAGYRELHKAILSGFLGQIGEREERRDYRGTRSSQFVLAPGSRISERPPRFVVAASLLETTRVYARMIAAVEPAWIESVARTLVKRSYSEPVWLSRPGYVAARETVSLFGLVLSSQRRVNYGPIAPLEARALFVMHALVLRDSRIAAPFLDANTALERELEEIEARLRRRDVLVDEGVRAEFYLARVPPRVSSVAAFERWCAHAEQADPRLLFMSREDLMARPVSNAELAGFPDTLRIAGNVLAVRYRFDPGAPDDGVTLIVPLPLVPALDPGELAWLIPGWRLEKIIAVLRGLPKSVRRQLVPVPDRARQALDELDFESGFFESLAHWLVSVTDEALPAAELAAIPLPDYLELNVRIVDEHGGVLAEGRRLDLVRRALRQRGVSVAPVTGRGADGSIHRRWDFGALAEQRLERRGHSQLVLYPGLEDAGDGVRVVDHATAELADAGLRRGIVRLAMLALEPQLKYMRKAFADRRELMLLGSALPRGRPFQDLLAERCIVDCFVPEDRPAPRDEAAFLARLEEGRGHIGECVDRIGALTESVFRELRAIRARFEELAAPQFTDAMADVTAQLERLVPQNFPASVPRQRLHELPRYLAAVRRRLDRLRGAAERDRALAARVAPFARALADLEQRYAAQGMPRPQALADFDDMIEEYRVSLFAQGLGTAQPVSDKRLAAQLERARASPQGARPRQ